MKTSHTQTSALLWTQDNSNDRGETLLVYCSSLFLTYRIVTCFLEMNRKEIVSSGSKSRPRRHEGPIIEEEELDTQSVNNRPVTKPGLMGSEMGDETSIGSWFD